jgi:hypothetical protein
VREEFSRKTECVCLWGERDRERRRGREKEREREGVRERYERNIEDGER